MDAFIADHLLGVSRTYAIVVPLLPAPLDETVGLAYLLMRIVDTLEDAPELTLAQREELFAQLDAALDGSADAARALTRPLGASDAERGLMSDATEVVRRVLALDRVEREAVCGCARAMGGGVLELLDRSAARGLPYPAIADLPELREYCYYVAGVVGEMLCTLMSRHLRHGALGDQRQAGVELGIGLQLVNIVKDVSVDAGCGRRYLPPAEPGDAVRSRAIGEARRCLTTGVDFVLAIPSAATGVRAFAGLPIVWGALTLARLQDQSGGTKIGREAISWTQAEFARRAASDEELRAWLLELLSAERATADP